MPPGTAGATELCSADAASDDQTWSCTPDLKAAGIPAGPLTLSFDVFDVSNGAQSITPGVDIEQVTYEAPIPTSPQAYLKEGIPEFDPRQL